MRKFVKTDDGYHVADEMIQDRPKKTKAVGYIRVSTKQQAGEDRLGIEAQKQAIQTYADREGYEIVRWYKDEISGVKENRDALDEILFGVDMDNLGAKAVIAYKSDRIARDIKLYFYYLFVLEKRHIKLLSVMEQFDDDAYGLSSVFRTLMLFVAEQERKNINARTSGGRRAKAAQGGYAGGKPPYGYCVMGKKLVVDESEAEMVREIFAYRDLGCCMQEIADLLNDKGYRTRKGRCFVSVNISKILNNRPVYEGYYRYGNMDRWVKGQHEAILKKQVKRIPEIELLAKEIEDEEAEKAAATDTDTDLNNEDVVANNTEVVQDCVDNNNEVVTEADEDAGNLAESTHDESNPAIGADLDELVIEDEPDAAQPELDEPVVEQPAPVGPVFGIME